MKKHILKPLLLSLTLLIVNFTFAQVDANFNTDGDLEGFTTGGPGVTGTVTGGFFNLGTGTGNNAQLRRSRTSVGDPATFTEIVIDVINNSNANEVVVQTLAGGTTTIVARQNISAADTSEQSYIISIPSSEATWVGTFQFRLRFVFDGGGMLDGNTIQINRIQIVEPTTLNVPSKTLEGVAVYPNPFTNYINITSPIGSNVSIYNLLGVKVKTIQNSDITKNLSVSDLGSGIYFVEVVNEGKVYKTKMIKS
ncbi:T9SS type A sorting domain-containing protein [Aquimarina sp. ERC-38]|uniref:T9SS type A sorting domain-containing protein n=1 Tax=Aquimarina sp. ERC-38 TaxID=2949996 RepID=UPI0022475E0E|nr:T9SS type A sorting domain-containing protein [Aquimarina sp. ERC-38]UZO82214.1 T9SS type A sorting domain-containing protein [Aquimarina sp. ERC-38]